ncbi:unnamed protein product [Clonostachys rosea]|uniref:CHK kinase-like domain-containing protein n=1 Tax=Bionectria ochroleuca TaxID=29856 RepID=A0ABY6UVI5_BIOOC|nr:unnamed protein product [Clonostachys rosea]
MATTSNEATIAKALPVVPEEVTKEWLAEVLGLKIKSVELTNAIHGTASKVFFAITYDESETASEKPEKICIKGGFNPSLTAAIPLLIDIYRREALFFANIAPKLTSMHLVKSWWAGENEKQGLVIMEDLGEKNYTFGKVKEPWTPDMVKKALEELAVLHATTWNQGPEDYPWLKSHYDEAVLGMLPAINYAQFVIDPERPPLPEPMRDQARVEAMLKKHFANRNPKFKCVIHGDCHIMNASVSPQGQIGLVDWQMLDSGSCFHDVAYFVTGSLTAEDRRAHEMDLLQHYLDMLHKYGGPKLSAKDEDVIHEYKKSVFSGIGWIVATTQMQPIDILYPMIERYVVGIKDHNVVELLESLP